MNILTPVQEIEVEVNKRLNDYGLHYLWRNHTWRWGRTNSYPQLVAMEDVDIINIIQWYMINELECL
jgi:hypothetical protein